jgi:putative ABC transport system permease protein
MARMSPSDILFLYRARLHARAVLVQEGFAILGIAVGVALLFSSQVASTSLAGSVTRLDQQIVGVQQFQLQARGPQGFAEELLGTVRRVPGVRSAFPVLEQQANVIGPAGRRSVDLIGTDPRLSRVAGPLLRRFSANQLAQQRAIVLPAPIAQAIGAGSLQIVRLQIGARTMRTLLGVALGQAEIGELVHSPVAIAPVAYAQRLTGMSGRLTRIFIRTLPGREREVQAALAKLAAAVGVNLEPADYDSRLFSVAVAPVSRSEALFSAISALVGFMFALGAMLITVPSRRRLIEELRPQGATRLMVVQILLFDAAVLGVLACVLGLALGELLSLYLFRATPGYLSFAFPVGDDRIVTWQSVLLAVGAGLAAAVIGVLWPLRDLFTRPVWAENRTKGSRRGWTVARLTAGLVCLAATPIVSLARNQGAFFGNLTLLVALVCLLPFLFDGLVALFERGQRHLGGAATVLAVTGLRTPQTRVRSLAIAATAAVAVFGAVEFHGIQENLTNGLDSSARGIDSSAEVWVTPSGDSSLLSTTPFRPIDSAALARLPGVAAVGSYRGSFLDWGERRLWILAPPASTPRPIPASQLLGGDSALAAARIRQGGWAVLSQALAGEHHLHVGQAFVLPAPRSTRLRVAALSTNLGWPPGTIILNAEDYARAWGSGDPSAYEIQTEPGASPATVSSLVRRALGGPEAGLVVETAGEREQRHYALAAQSLSRLAQIRMLVLIAAVLAVAGALGSMLWQRCDLVAFMKVDGYRRGVLWRWLLCESAILLVAGCAIGAVFGLYAQLLGSHFLASATGFPIVSSVQALAALSSLALVSVSAVVAAALPGYLVARVPPRAASPAY